MTFDDFRACIDARISNAYGPDEADLYLITEELQKLDIKDVRELIRDIASAAPSRPRAFSTIWRTSSSSRLAPSRRPTTMSSRAT